MQGLQGQTTWALISAPPLHVWMNMGNYLSSINASVVKCWILENITKRTNLTGISEFIAHLSKGEHHFHNELVEAWRGESKVDIYDVWGFGLRQVFQGKGWGLIRIGYRSR